MMGSGESGKTAAGNIAPVCLLLFVFAGYYKAADLLRFAPIDLTLLFWAVTALLCGLALWRQRRLPPGSLPMLAVFVAMAIGLHWPEDLSSYASQKELRLFSLTAVAAFAPLVLLREPDQRRSFLYAAVLLGLAMAAAAVVEAARLGLYQRIDVFNSNPILLARASGFAGLLLCLLYWHGRVSLAAFAPAALLLLFGLVASGTKAPLLATLLAGLMVLPSAFRHSALRRRILGTVIVSLVAMAGGVFYLVSAGSYIGTRMVRAMSGEWRDAETTRLELWGQTLALVPERPLGIGWGRLSEWIEVPHEGKLLQHPHNILLEVTLEAGWLAGVLLIALVVVTTAGGILKLYRQPEAPDVDGLDHMAVFGALIYWLVCASFSGDVNDNRPLWAILGMVLAAQSGKGTGQQWR